MGISRPTMTSSFHFKILGGLWAVLGGVPAVALIATLRAILMDPAGGYDVLPVFIILIPLPLALLGVVNSWALIARRRVARPLTLALSSLLVFVSAMFLLGLLGSALPTFLRFGPVPVLAAIGVYGLWTMLSHRGKEAFRLHVGGT